MWNLLKDFLKIADRSSDSFQIWENVIDKNEYSDLRYTVLQIQVEKFYLMLKNMKIKKKNTLCIFQLLYLDRKGVYELVGKGVFGSRYSRMDQLKFVVDNL